MTFHVIAQVENKHCIFARDGVQLYVFRYAYPTMDHAEKVLKNLKEGFGKPAGVATDLAVNYWKLKYGTVTRNVPYLKFVQRTTQKETFYIPQPEYT